MKREGASVLNYLHRCWRHRSRHSPSTSSSKIRSVKGRIGGGTSSWRGGLISRKKSSKNLLKVFSSLAEPAIASHSWRDQRQLEPGKKSTLLWIIGWSDSVVARVGEGARSRERRRIRATDLRDVTRGRAMERRGGGVRINFTINPFNPIDLWRKFTFDFKGSKLIMKPILHKTFYLYGVNSHVTSGFIMFDTYNVWTVYDWCIIQVFLSYVNHGRPM